MKGVGAVMHKFWTKTQGISRPKEIPGTKKFQAHGKRTPQGADLTRAGETCERNVGRASAPEEVRQQGRGEEVEGAGEPPARYPASLYCSAVVGQQRRAGVPEPAVSGGPVQGPEEQNTRAAQEAPGTEPKRNPSI